MKLRHLLPLLAIVLIAGSVPSCTGATGGPFRWPDVAKCGADIGNLVGVVTQILLNDTGKEAPTPETKTKLEQLGRQYGAETILCLVDRLARDWTAVGASASPQRFAAGMRGKAWLADVGTQLRRDE